MNKKLLWSWNSDNPEINKLQLPLSENIEKIIAMLLLTIIFAIMVIFIAPILGSWAAYLFIVIYVLLIPYTLKNYKIYPKALENNYINIYQNSISINYFGYNANYELKNIDLNSLKIKTIIVGTSMGFAWSKALCFKTISPKMHMKIPLPVLEPSQTELSKAIKVLINRSS